MKRLTALGLLLASLLCCDVAAQTDSLIHVNQFPGNDVGTLVSEAMAHCPAAPLKCYLILDASLAAYANGTMPTLPANAQLIDFRANWPGAGLASGTYLHIPYYTLSPSGPFLGADSVATTDGAGNFSLASLVATVNANTTFPGNNSVVTANFNANLPASSWTNSPTGLYANIEDSVSDSTSNAGLLSQGQFLQVYHNGSGKIDSLGGTDIDVELCGIQACTGSLNWEFGLGGDMENEGGTIGNGTAWDASEDSGMQGFHMEYENLGTTDFITDIASLVHVGLRSGSTTNTVAGIHIFNNILPGSGVTLPNLYGIYINPLQGKATNVYGIYSEGTEPNFFGGKVQAQSLQVTGCAAGTYVKADGSGCATPAGSISYGHLGATSCATGTTSYSTCTSTVTISPGFADTAYYPTCAGESPSDGRAAIIGCTPATGTTVTVTVATEGSVSVSYGDLYVLAAHP